MGFRLFTYISSLASVLLMGCAPDELSKQLTRSKKPSDLTHFLVADETLGRYLINDLRVNLGQVLPYLQDLNLNHSLESQTESCKSFLLEDNQESQKAFTIEERACRPYQNFSFSRFVFQMNGNKWQTLTLKSRSQYLFTVGRGSKNFVKGEMSLESDVEGHIVPIAGDSKSFRFEFFSSHPYILELKSGSVISHEKTSYIKTLIRGRLVLGEELSVEVDDMELTHFQDKFIFDLKRISNAPRQKSYNARLVLSPQTINFSMDSDLCVEQSTVNVESLIVGRPFYPIKSRQILIEKGEEPHRLSLSGVFTASSSDLENEKSGASIRHCSSSFKVLYKEIFFPARLEY